MSEHFVGVQGGAAPVESPEVDANALVPFDEDAPELDHAMVPASGARRGGRARTKASERRARKQGVKSDEATAEGGAARSRSQKCAAWSRSCQVPKSCCSSVVIASD